MRLIKTVFKVIVLPAIIISILLSLLANMSTQAKETLDDNKKVKSKRPPHVTCYKPCVVTPEERKIRNLKAELMKLEQMYSEGKISEKTYKIRNQNLESQIEKLQAE